MFARASVLLSRSATSHNSLFNNTQHLVSPGLRFGFLRTMATSDSLPSKISGVIIEKTGGRDVLQHTNDLPIPQPQGDEILVKNAFIGVNYIDT